MVETLTIVKTLFSVLLAALLLTIFEIVFFGMNISGTITTTVSNLVNKFADSLGKNVNGIFRLPESTINAIADEEAILVKKYNESVMYDGWWIAGLLFMGLLGVGGYLHEHRPKDLEDSFKDWYPIDYETILFTCGTVFLFAMFQLYFLKFVSMGGYLYPTTTEAQLIATNAMIDTLERNLNTPPPAPHEPTV